MQQLPISYFDQHSHDDLMSVYTNDIDTLRQMISSLPGIF
jgi:ATP-binding cassette subfamily B protein